MRTWLCRFLMISALFTLLGCSTQPKSSDVASQVSPQKYQDTAGGKAPGWDFYRVLSM